MYSHFSSLTLNFTYFATETIICYDFQLLTISWMRSSYLIILSRLYISPWVALLIFAILTSPYSVNFTLLTNCYYWLINSYYIFFFLFYTIFLTIKVYKFYYFSFIISHFIIFGKSIKIDKLELLSGITLNTSKDSNKPVRITFPHHVEYI